MTIVLSVSIFFTLADKVDTYFIEVGMEVYLLLMSVMLSLVINSRIKNGLLEFMNTFFVFFYILRIPFIFSDSVSSDVLSRGVSIQEVPWYIFMLAVQYLYMVVAILIVNPKISKNIIKDVVSEKVFKRVLLFCYLILFLNYLRTYLFFDIHEGNSLHFIWAILGSIFTERNILLLVIIMSIVSKKILVLKYKYSVAMIVLMIIVLGVYGGSKSITIEFFLVLYLGLLVAYGPLKLKIRNLMVVFFGGIIGIFMYFFGIVTRGLHVGKYDYNIDNFLYIMNSRFEFSVEYFANGISYRIGYFDFFIQKISSSIYEPYVNLSYYFQSIVDKITPGFDIFGVQYVAAAIFSAYHGESDVANSEFITVFGEAYILFGLFSFFFYLAMLLLIKYAILKFKSPYTLNIALFRLFIMFNFYLWLRGPGLDMLTVFIIYKGIFILFVMAIIKYYSSPFCRSHNEKIKI